MTPLHRTAALTGSACSKASLVLLILLISASVSRADVVPGYPFSAFTLTNYYGDGTAVPGPGLVLTGPNTGSDLAGSTWFTTTILADAVLTFHYLFMTDDLPGYDSASYVVGSDILQPPFATLSGQSGDINVPVRAGQTFGFIVFSTDNQGFPGVLTIGEPPTGTPEPASFVLVSAGLLLAISHRCRRNGRASRRA